MNEPVPATNEKNADAPSPSVGLGFELPSFEYWEQAYFEGWLGNLIAGAFVVVILIAILDA
ncbi:MAG: hypothetical protein ABIU85_09545 [Methylotenera sp.]